MDAFVLLNDKLLVKVVFGFLIATKLTMTSSDGQDFFQGSILRICILVFYGCIEEKNLLQNSMYLGIEVLLVNFIDHFIVSIQSPQFGDFLSVFIYPLKSVTQI